MGVILKALDLDFWYIYIDLYVCTHILNLTSVRLYIYFPSARNHVSEGILQGNLFLLWSASFLRCILLMSFKIFFLSISTGYPVIDVKTLLYLHCSNAFVNFINSNVMFNAQSSRSKWPSQQPLKS